MWAWRGEILDDLESPCRRAPGRTKLASEGLKGDFLVIRSSGRWKEEDSEVERAEKE